MRITHNEINQAILEMEALVAKGQPFAKRNKERRVRAVLRDMRSKQTTPPTIRDVRFYVKMWLINRWRMIRKAIMSHLPQTLTEPHAGR